MYKTLILPLARQDLIDIAAYIKNTLQNPNAAQRFSEKVIAEIESLSSFPYRNPVYRPIRPLEKEFRQLLVQNYAVFYWVEEAQQQVKIARVVYARRDHISNTKLD